MTIYEFYWSDNSTLVEINEDDKEKIEELLNKYRNNNEDYNIDGWCDFLIKNDYVVEICQPEYSLYF